MVLAAAIAEGRKDWAKAEEAYRLALDLRLTISRTSMVTATAYHNLGSFLIERARYAEARPVQIVALKIARSLRTADHPRRVAITKWMARCFLRLGQNGEARTLFREAAQGFDERLRQVRRMDTGEEALARRQIFAGQVEAAWKLAGSTRG